VTVERDKRGRFLTTAGRPHGTRNRRSLAAEHLPADALPRLYAALYAQALEGDVAAASALLARLDPVRKGAPLELPDLPALVDVASAKAASAWVLAVLGEGALSPEEARMVQELLTRHVELGEASAVRADVDRVLAHLGLPRDAPPGEIASALAANGHAAGQHQA
jgi:hypothetical protein